jgi:ribosome biogenesis GTPase
MKVTVPPDTEGRGVATVISSTRRFVHLLESNGKRCIARTRSKAVEAVVGDKVLFEGSGEHAIVVEVLPAQNTLSRSYRDETKRLAANLNELFIVTALGPLFNTYFIDRIMAVASAELIPFTLVINKIDLGESLFEPLIKIYRDIEVPMLHLSAKFGQGLESLRAKLSEPQIEVAALCGISGVGKSSILNVLLPDIQARTDEVSTRTGQGKQTTTQAFGYTYPRSRSTDLLLIDLPGVQSFGITHLTKEQVGNAFPEEQCGVVKAVESGLLPFSRYESYAKMIAEIDDAKRY